MASAIALVTASNLGELTPGEDRAAILGDIQAADVLGALTTLLTVALRFALARGQDEQDASETVAAFLQGLGLRVLEESAR